MIKHWDFPRFPAVAKVRQFSVGAKRLAVGVLFTLLLVQAGAGAESPDEQYVRIHGLIESADASSQGGDFDLAKSKYQQAQTQLQSLKKSNPIWNPRLVALRLDYLAQRIAAMSHSNAPLAAATSPPALKPAAPTATVPASESVKLLEAGAEPRRVLRLNPKPGDRQTLVMTMKMGMGMSQGDAPADIVNTPPIQMTLDGTVKAVSANGEIAYELVVADVHLIEEAGMDPQLARELKASVVAAKGLVITGAMSNRGLNQKLKTASASGATPQSRQLLEEFHESLALVGVPLPAEPVGPGAKWEVKSPIKSQGLTLNQTAQYEWTAMAGDRLRLTQTVVQSTTGQKAQGQRMTSSGHGNVDLDLAKLLPVSATLKSRSDIALGTGAPGQKEAMTMKMEMEVRLEAK